MTLTALSQDIPSVNDVSQLIDAGGMLYPRPST
jgi:hypothetical protein